MFSFPFLPSLIYHTLRHRVSEHMTREQRQKRNYKRLSSHLSWVISHSAYYKQIAPLHGISLQSPSLSAFPVLTKHDLMTHFDDIVTDKSITQANLNAFAQSSKNPLETYQSYHVIHSSGTSGNRGFMVYSPFELACGLAYTTRSLGIRFGDKLAYIASTQGHFAGVTMAYASTYVPFVYKDTLIIDINQPLDEICTQLESFQPTVLIGYGFILHQLSSMQAQGKLHISPRIIGNGGEAITTQAWNHVEQVFKVPLINIYASSELLYMGIGSRAFDGIYLMEDDLIFEIEQHEIYVTSLFHKTVPLIRYKISDSLTPIPDTTHQYSFTKVSQLIGRQESVMWLTNDDGETDFIHPLTLIDIDIAPIHDFQFHIVSDTECVIYIMYASDASTEQKQKARDQMKAQCMHIFSQKRMNSVMVTVRDDAVLTCNPRTGKFALVVDDRTK